MSIIQLPQQGPALKAIDLFAGGGGTTEGALQAGVDVVWAGNHWGTAVATHERNHPGIIHAQEDLHRTDWTKVPGHDILLASPACQGHSKARGKESPHHEALRATAWCVVSAAEVHSPEVLIVENVPEFLEWRLFPAWQLALEALGYHLTTQVLDAVDFGLAQRRERVFVCGHRKAPLHLFSPGLARVPASSIIQWDHPKAKLISSRTQPLAERTQACIDHGRRVYGERFLVPYYGYERRARNPEKPLGTLTTNNHFGVYSEGTFRMLSVAEMKAAQGFPADYWLPANTRDAIKLIGNSVPPPMARHMVLQAKASLLGGHQHLASA